MKKRSVVSVKRLVAACCAFCFVGLATVSAWADCFSDRLPDIRKKAEQGDANAEFTLGVFYLQAECGLREDIELGVEWMRRAAEHGHEEAKDFLKRNGL